MASKHSRQPAQRGAALLLAMMVLVAVTTVAAGMVWMQMRALQVEAAERARAQAGWILGGALDWARLILREDFRSGRQRGRQFDSLDEPWATPLAEARLSSFLAADRDNNAVDSEDALQAFISGGIADAQAKLNLNGLVDPQGKPVADRVAALDRLAALAGAPADSGDVIAAAMARAVLPLEDPAQMPLKPVRLDDLAWLGIDPALLQRLAPWVDLLPQDAPVNANTASRAVLRAALDIDPGVAERLVQTRQRQPFQTLEDLQAFLGSSTPLPPGRVNVASSWFEVWGRLRLDERVVEERSLVKRDGDQVSVLRRERRSWVGAEEAPR